MGHFPRTTLTELQRPRLHGAAAWLPTAVAVAAGVVFISTAIGHLGNHDAEVADFRRYQAPFVSLAVWGAGVVELAGGLALLFELLVRSAAAVLAADMIAAVAATSWSASEENGLRGPAQGHAGFCIDGGMRG